MSESMISESMPESMPAEFWAGIEQFNRQEFYACHDTLEALWMEAVEPEKTFYQGILQIAVGFYHLGNQNLHGAIVLLGEGMNRLRRYQPEFAGIDLERLLAESQSMQAELQQLQQSQLAEQKSGQILQQIQPPAVFPQIVKYTPRPESNS
jgi:predicted metal-dependent hydrolase